MNSSSLPKHQFGNSKSISKLSYTSNSISQSIDVNKTIYNFKVILIGNISVGKTCILSRYMESKYTPDNKPSIGVEFKSKTLSIDKSTSTSLKIWDTCGDEKYSSITRQYYHKAKGIILVFDLTDRNSFEKLDTCLNDIETYAPNKINIFLVGNKCDLAEERVVSASEDNEFASNNHFPYLDVSAKDGRNVSLVLRDLRIFS